MNDLIYVIEDDEGVQEVYESAADVWSFSGIALLYVAAALVVAFVLSYVLAKNLSYKVEARLVGLRDGLRSANSGDYAIRACDTSDALDFSIISELNGLASSLKENYETLRTDENSPDYKYIKRIHTESVRLHNIVMDMLYISRLESREVARNRDDVNLGDLATESFQSYKEEVSAKGLKVTVEGEAHVEGDEHKLYECAHNIIGNAVHYNKQDGFVAVRLSQKDGNAVFEVEDGGIGIAKEHLPYICERFYRVDKSRSRQTGGTGLGLSIVKHVVALYGGTLSIDSKEGDGTVVTVTLPSKRADK